VPADEHTEHDRVTVSQKWIDKLEIRELLERYMRYNDDRAADQLVELLDEDIRFQVVGRVYAGREEVRQLFSTADADPPHWTEPGELLKQPGSVHVSSNPIIEVDGDTATAETDFLVVNRDRSGRAHSSLVGRYRDRLRRREDGRWVITTRTGVSVARPGQERTDDEWQRVLAAMPQDERAKFRM
jgi:ketosteroid isomerase-like protein